jgi:hypothetical protein
MKNIILYFTLFILKVTWILNIHVGALWILVSCSFLGLLFTGLLPETNQIALEDLNGENDPHIIPLNDLNSALEEKETKDWDFGSFAIALF